MLSGGVPCAAVGIPGRLIRIHFALESFQEIHRKRQHYKRGIFFRNFCHGLQETESISNFLELFHRQAANEHEPDLACGTKVDGDG